MPRRVNGRLEASITRSTSLTARAVWDLCAGYFDPHQNGRPAIGRGVGPAAPIFEQGLDFDADGNPYSVHANIVGWYEEPGKEDKDVKHHWKHAAQRIAAEFPYEAR